MEINQSSFLSDGGKNMFNEVDEQKKDDRI